MIIFKEKKNRGVKTSKRSVSPCDEKCNPKKRQTSTTSTATDTSTEYKQAQEKHQITPSMDHPLISRQARHHQKPATPSILLPTKEPLAIDGDATWKCLPPPKVDAIRRKRKERTFERLLQIHDEYDQMIKRQQKQEESAKKTDKKKNSKKKNNKKSKNKKENIKEAKTIPELIQSYQQNKKLQKFRFARNVSIRVYNQILGDHPCVSSGLPVQLGWTYRGESMDFASYGKQNEQQEQRQQEKKKVPKQSNGNRTTKAKRKQKINDDELTLSSCPTLSPERRLEIVSTRSARKNATKKQQRILQNIKKVQRQRYRTVALWWNVRKLQEIIQEDIPNRIHQRRRLFSRRRCFRSKSSIKK